MTTIVSIANEKGGVGKTTSTVNIGAGLIAHGKKVMLVDLDQQGNLSDYLGYAPQGGSRTISDALFNKVSGYDISYDDFICHSAEGLDYIPANKMLASITSVLGNARDSQYVLKEILHDSYFSKYDYILIDCRPSLDLLVVNALTASNGLIIPLQGEKFAYDAVGSTIDTFTRTKALNPNLQLYGLLLTMVNQRTNMFKAVKGAVEEEYGDKVFETVIPRLTEATNSTNEQKSLVASKGKLGEQYLRVAQELINRCE